MLRTGSRGDEVAVLQQRLRAVGFDPGAADGAFGPNTEAALRAFQEKAGIAVDGVAGPDTNAKLAEFQAAGLERLGDFGKSAESDGPAPL